MRITDFLSWTAYEPTFKECADLTPLEKSRACQALKDLEAMLGRDFLKNMAERYPDEWQTHPIFSLLLNFAPWTRKELTQIAEELLLLRQCDNFTQFLGHLKELQKVEHDLLVISTAARLVQQGLNISFEPTLPIAENQRQPDLRIENPRSKELLFLEASVLGSAPDSGRAFRAMHKLLLPLMSLGSEMIWAGQLLKIPATPHLEEISDAVTKAAERAKAEQRFVQSFEEGTYSIAFCPKEKAEVLEQWCSGLHVRPGELIGPNVDDSSIDRLSRKICKEQEQLPEQRPNVILIKHADVFFRSSDIREVINILEEEVYKYPKILLAIIHGTHLGSSAPIVASKGAHRYTRRFSNEVKGEDNLILVNRYASEKISADTLTKFFNVF